MKRTILSITLVGAAFCLQSCLHDDTEVFDTPAAERINEAVKADKQLLESATNGWLFEYYLGEEAEYGGFTYLVKFENGKAHVSGEIADDSLVTTSSYDVIKDMGPVLTFNTYNEIMHYNSQPYSDMVDGYNGDYEFLILRATQDSIYLKGKKWGNHMLLTRLPEEVVWKEYLQSLDSIRTKMMYTFAATVAGDSLGFIEFGEEYNTVVYTHDGETTEEIPFVFVPDGVKLKTPLDLNGQQAQHFTYDYDQQSFRCTDASATGVTLNLSYPEGWKPYDFYVGSYVFPGVYDGKAEVTRNVTVTANDDGRTYTVRGMTSFGQAEGVYNKAHGTLDIATQQVAALKYSDGSPAYLWLTPCNGQSLSWYSGYYFRSSFVEEDGAEQLVFSSASGYPTFWEFIFTTDPPTEAGMAGWYSKYPEPMVFVKQ